MPVGPRSGKEDHIRQIHPSSSVCSLDRNQFLSKCKRFPRISSMGLLHRALPHALQGSDPFKGHFVFHVVRASSYYVPVNSKTVHSPGQSWGNPRHLTRFKLRTMGNLIQNETRPVEHLTFVSKRLSTSGQIRVIACKLSYFAAVANT